MDALAHPPRLATWVVPFFFVRSRHLPTNRLPAVGINLGTFFWLVLRPLTLCSQNSRIVTCKDGNQLVLHVVI